MKTLLACVASAALGAAAIGGSGLAAGEHTVVLRPDQRLTIQGYRYTCESTSRTPNFGCQYGPPDRPARTPIWTVFKGSRTVVVQSLARPHVSHQSGIYETTITR